MKAVINGKILLKDRMVEDMVLLMSDVFEGIVSADMIPADAEVIDAEGGYVAPGLSNKTSCSCSCKRRSVRLVPIKPAAPRINILFFPASCMFMN